ncbi:MAG: 3'(2'),5'-bisphosphate nucleotidase CysQ [Bacteroidota bacterium]
MKELEDLLQTAIRAAVKAGEEILNVYGTDFEVEKKADKSPLTLADKNSHDVIMHELTSTGIPVLSEEGKDIPYSERRNWKRLWIVDPLDGTKEFVKRNGEFTVNIALVEERQPVLGVIFVPVTGALYYGARGKGAFRRLKDRKDERLPLKRVNTGYTVVVSRSHMSPETKAYVDELGRRHKEIDFVASGSSLKICLVAEGSADCYPRFGPTMEWDTAAGQAIAEQAGKSLIDCATDKPMEYNRSILRNGWFIVK